MNIETKLFYIGIVLIIIIIYTLIEAALTLLKERRNKKERTLEKSIKDHDYKEHIRDHFAMRAMSGILSNPVCDYNIKDLSKLSCEIADAMMEERGGRWNE